MAMRVPIAAGGNLGFDYVNARLRARKRQFLTAAAYERLLLAPDIEALIGALGQSPYRRALEQALSTHSGLAAVLRALQVDFGATLQQLQAFCAGQAAPLFALLIRPYWRHNVLTLLRGVAARSDPGQVVPLLIAVAPFTEGILSELARQPSLRRLVDLLAQRHLPDGELAQALVAALARSDELRSLELAFDRAWAGQTSAQVAALRDPNAALLRLWWARQMDLHNLLVALALGGAAQVMPETWLPGGQLDARTLEAVRTAGDAGRLAEVLETAPGGAFWVASVRAWDGAHAAGLQQLWEQALARWQIGLFRTADPLGVGILMAYLAAKEVEIRNLRLIAQAVAGNLDRAEAQGRLMVITSY
ncbi:MAG: V-type ATPase subunit [Caldilineales bacterium]|nr:V-type ATPase subunit [Caldilineales bacterium]